MKILGDGFGVLVTIQDTCSSAPLVPGEVCFVRAAAVNSAMSCDAIVPGNVKNFRGSLEVRDISNNTIVHEDLR
ncbi:MAG: hypothetical protein C5B48_12545 [Candidatus Rokuibacteriota bacterium]|nr:MAG: hypothetical protein C5B48_12545 [Candidatus Rokubacteria bacterium]